MNQMVLFFLMAPVDITTGLEGGGGGGGIYSCVVSY